MMQNPAEFNDQQAVSGPVESKRRFQLALGVAVVLHLLILLLPLQRQRSDIPGTPATVDLQLTFHDAQSQADLSVPVPLPEPLPLPSPEPFSEPPPRAETSQVQTDDTTRPPGAYAEIPNMPPQEPVQSPDPINRDLKQMSSVEKSRLTGTILSRQFITQEPVADRLFGKLVTAEATQTRKEFHYPVRRNLVSMLDRPMQELPFKYTPGLVHFAYAPGVKGDLQRFWDVITPEFGWTTRYGTEVKCIWVLIVGGCGWK